MLDLDILDDCLIELPPFGSFPVKGFRKVNEPVRITEPDAWIHEDGDRRREPIGLVYSTPDGRQVFFPIEGVNFAYHKARYLLEPSSDLHQPTLKVNNQPLSKVGPEGDLVSSETQQWLRLACEGPQGPDTLPKAQIA